MAAPARPNILWLVAEDLSPYIAPFGDSTVETPNLDRLAREGVRYSNVYSVSGVCAPSRAALVTGMYPTSIGAHHMRTIHQQEEARKIGLIDYEVVPPPQVRMVSEILRRHGYYASNNAKEDYQFQPSAMAWDESSLFAHWRNRAPGQPFFAVFNFGVTHEGQLWAPATIWNLRYGRAVFPPDRRQELIWKPFPPGVEKELLVPRNLKVQVPPYLPDTEAVRRDMRRMYSNIVEMDGHVGVLLRQLEEDGLLEETIVVWFSDHGGPLPRQKRLLYDSGLRVPLIVRHPGRRRAGELDERLVSLVDFAPTLLSQAGIPIPGQMQGRPIGGGAISRGARGGHPSHERAISRGARGGHPSHERAISRGAPRGHPSHERAISRGAPRGHPSQGRPLGGQALQPGWAAAADGTCPAGGPADCAVPTRRYVFAAADRFDGHYDMIRAVRDVRFKYLRNYRPKRGYYLPLAYREQMATMQELLRLRDAGGLNEVQSQWFRASKPTEELFDTWKDPHELRNLAEDPAYAAKLAELRQACQDWMEAVGDLGFIPEDELIERFWPGRKQPRTAAPVVRLQDGDLLVSSATESASIGYRFLSGDSPSRSPAEGFFMRGVAPSRSPAEGSFMRGAGPSRSPAEGSPVGDQAPGRGWRVYTGALRSVPGRRFEFLAHRIGYAPSEVVAYAHPQNAVDKP